MFKHILSLRAVALFAGICLLALSGYGIFSSSLQGRVMWSGKLIPSVAVARDVKAGCDDYGKKSQEEYRISQEKRKALAEAERAKLEKMIQEQEQRDAQQLVQHEAEIKELEKLAVPFRRQLKRGDYVSHRGTIFQCRGMVINVSPPLAEIQWGGSLFEGSRIGFAKIENLYPCKDRLK